MSDSTSLESLFRTPSSMPRVSGCLRLEYTCPRSWSSNASRVKMVRSLCCRDRQGIPGEPWRASALGFDWLHSRGQRKSSTVTGPPHVQFTAATGPGTMAKTARSPLLMLRSILTPLKSSIIHHSSLCKLQGLKRRLEHFLHVTTA